MGDFSSFRFWGLGFRAAGQPLCPSESQSGTILTSTLSHLKSVSMPDCDKHAGDVLSQKLENRSCNDGALSLDTARQASHSWEVSTLDPFLTQP